MSILNRDLLNRISKSQSSINEVIFTDDTGGGEKTLGDIEPCKTLYVEVKGDFKGVLSVDGKVGRLGSYGSSPKITFTNIATGETFMSKADLKATEISEGGMYIANISPYIDIRFRTTISSGSISANVSLSTAYEGANEFLLSKINNEDSYHRQIFSGDSSVTRVEEKNILNYKTAYLKIHGDFNGYVTFSAAINSLNFYEQFPIVNVETGEVLEATGSSGVRIRSAGTYLIGISPYTNMRFDTSISSGTVYAELVMSKKEDLLLLEIAKIARFSKVLTVIDSGTILVTARSTVRVWDNMKLDKYDQIVLLGGVQSGVSPRTGVMTLKPQHSLSGVGTFLTGSNKVFQIQGGRIIDSGRIDVTSSTMRFEIENNTDNDANYSYEILGVI